MRGTAFGVILACLSAAATANELQSTPIYDPAVDAREARDVLLQDARQKGVRALLIFGADWCPDCRKLADSLTTQPLSGVMKQNFVYHKVDIGRWDNNMDFAAEYENAASNGIPSIAVLDPDGRLLFITKGRQLARARSLTDDQLAAFFAQVVQILGPVPMTETPAAR